MTVDSERECVAIRADRLRRRGRRGRPQVGNEVADGEVHLVAHAADHRNGRSAHGSGANTTDDRRIGLNVQYLAPHVRQTKHDHDSAMLVRGEDRYGNFKVDTPAVKDFDPAAVQRWHELDQLHIDTQGTA